MLKVKQKISIFKKYIYEEHEAPVAVNKSKQDMIQLIALILTFMKIFCMLVLVNKYSIRASYLKTFTIITIFIFIVCLFLYCTDRGRLNPIDPQNPDTAGRPQGLSIYSEQDRAVLQWRQFKLKNIKGYRIYRRQDSYSAFIPINLAPPDSNQYTDCGLAYNKKYDYFVTVLAEDFETSGSDTVSIIPGPTIIWATDVTNRRILKISHDGAHEIKQIPVDGYPWVLVFDNEENVLWYTDIFLNRVYNVKSETFNIILDISYGEPIDMVIDKSNNRVWIADETQGKIFVFNRQGDKIGEKGGFQSPVCIDCFSNDGSCWVADSRAFTVTKISNNLETTVQIKDLIYPSSVSVNQLKGDCWVADSSRILKYDMRGKLRLSIKSELNYPKHLAVDSELNTCWVLDFSHFDYQSRLLCFNNSGEKLLELSGFTRPENLIVNLYDHSCIVADSGTGRILKISLNGAVIGRVTGYDYTYGLFIQI